MTDLDIVRELHGAADRAGLVCTNTGNFRAAMIDAAHLRAAADEIERLRSVVKEWKTYSSRAERDIVGLREERDEARREVCVAREALIHLMTHGNVAVPQEAMHQAAKARGWDCFKEGKP